MKKNDIINAFKSFPEIVKELLKSLLWLIAYIVLSFTVLYTSAWLCSKGLIANGISSLLTVPFMPAFALFGVPIAFTFPISLLIIVTISLIMLVIIHLIRKASCEFVQILRKHFNNNK